MQFPTKMKMQISILIELSVHNVSEWVHWSAPNLVRFQCDGIIIVFKNGPSLASLSSFQTSATILTTNKCEKMSIQCAVLGFELTTFGTWVSSHKPLDQGSCPRLLRFQTNLSSTPHPMNRAGRYYLYILFDKSCHTARLARVSKEKSRLVFAKL